MKPYRSQRVALRGLDSHVLTWGDPAAPKLFLLHGWMDVAASFQFLVDALERERYVIAPDLRGYGKSAWQPQGYWYADYIADLEALLQAFAPGESVDLAGHSLGGNVVLHYAGVRPTRARRVISLDGFGVRAEESSAAPEKIAKWLDALADPKDFATLRELRRRRRPAAEEQPAPDAGPGCLSRAALGRSAAGRSRAACLRSAPQAAVSDDLPDRGDVRGVAQHHRADALGRRRGLEHPEVAGRSS